MKYFNPSYWFKLWVLSAPLFNYENQGIYAKSIDNNQKIKDWISKDITSLDTINQEISYTNTSNYQSYNLNETNQNINTIYQTELEISTNKHRHEKSRRFKRQLPPNEQDWSISLNVPNVTQVGTVYCGPAVAESLLKHLGLNETIVLNHVNADRINNRYLNIQHYIASKLEINAVDKINHTISGTLPYRLNDIINDILRMENYNGLSYYTEWFRAPRYFGINPLAPISEISPPREINYSQLETLLNFQYGLMQRLAIPLNRRNQFIMEIERNFRQDFVRTLDSLVRWNLQNNRPIIFAQSFQPSAREYGHVGRHFVLIDSIGPEVENLEEVRYRFMDPGNGHYVTQNALDMYYRGGDVFSLTVDYNSINLIQNPIPIAFPNQEEPMEIGNYNNVVTDFLNFEINQNCRRNKRQTKQISTNNYWHEKLCYLKLQIDKIQAKKTAIKILDENTKGGNLKAGDIYVGTDNGVYLIHGENQVHRFLKLDFPIKDIILDGNGSAYVINNNCEIYHLDLLGWGSKKVKVDNITLEEFSNLITVIKKSDYSWFGKINIIKKLPRDSKDGHLKAGDMYVGTDKGIFAFYSQKQINLYNELGKINITDINFINNFIDGIAYVIDDKCEIYYFEGWYPKKIDNMESCDLNKELKLYYNSDKSSKYIYNSWRYTKNNNKIVQTFNLKNINPIDNFNKGEFLGSDDDFQTKISWGSEYFIGINLNWFNNFKISEKLINFHYDKNNLNLMDDRNTFNIQLKKSWFSSWPRRLEHKQSVGLSFYWEFNNWYLQVLIHQYADSIGGSLIWGAHQTYIGKGIRLYNDDDLSTSIINENISKIETKTNDHINDELRKKRSIESNENKWINDLSKDINHKEYLPINNKTNFSTNNITSL